MRKREGPRADPGVPGMAKIRTVSESAGGKEEETGTVGNGTTGPSAGNRATGPQRAENEGPQGGRSGNRRRPGEGARTRAEKDDETQAEWGDQPGGGPTGGIPTGNAGIDRTPPVGKCQQFRERHEIAPFGQIAGGAEIDGAPPFGKFQQFRERHEIAPVGQIAGGAEIEGAQSVGKFQQFGERHGIAPAGQIAGGGNSAAGEVPREPGFRHATGKKQGERRGRKGNGAGETKEGDGRG